MTAAFTLYGNVNSQPAARIALFFRLAGLPFSYRHVDLPTQQQKTPGYLAINRFGRVPTLVHEGRSLSESSVILTYLAEQTGQFGGRDAGEKLRLAEWLSWLADVLLPVQRCRALRKFKGDPNALPWVEASAANGLALFDQHLAGHDFIEGGRVTIADIFAFPWIDLLEESGVDAAKYPNIQAWAARIRAQPGFKPQYDLMPTQDAEC
ncbi:glutathione S-transferase family protein [Azospirillum doebereinerae]|uniref:Glutathione S-transferase family protein n=1 Tax=Azospirillum doebereinerae TaxID=92933 RepID=A0A3S0V3S1_9PROT|nr:glutathione S-transferase family protein [Azospirillum doebereinerae]RUQ64543.1 glutathione S-transferase family protein [Azospirillum doebereinerae]